MEKLLEEAKLHNPPAPEMVPINELYNPQYDVEEFMDVFGQELPEVPVIPDEKTCLLRARLIWEEALETIRAFGCDILALDSEGNGIGTILSIELDTTLIPSIVEIADGCADLLVVTHGAALACGIDIYPVFNEVHRSNMSKMWKGENGPEVRRREDGKITKSPDYSPADISPILIDQGWEG